MRALILGCSLALLIASSTKALTLTFDDITTENIWIVPDGYGGLDWINFAVEDGTNNPGSGYYNGVVSGRYVAWNNGALQATVSASDYPVFSFRSAYLTAAWNNDLNIRVRGMRFNSVQYDTTVTVDTAGPTLFNFDYFNVTHLIFDSYGGVDDPGLSGMGTHFAMDQMTIETVPEPGTGLLVIAGLLGLASRRCRAAPRS
jgi:hypothetical protein